MYYFWPRLELKCCYFIYFYLDMQFEERQWIICYFLLCVQANTIHFFVFFTKIGCILLSVRQDYFYLEAIHSLNYVVNQSDYTVQTLGNVTTYLSLTNSVSVVPNFSYFRCNEWYWWVKCGPEYCNKYIGAEEKWKLRQNSTSLQFCIWLCVPWMNFNSLRLIHS